MWCYWLKLWKLLTDDEVPQALALSYRIFAGYNKCIRKFDLHRPGRDFELYSTVKDKKEGQTGFFFLPNLDY